MLGLLRHALWVFWALPVDTPRAPRVIVERR
jgi:hypothetical protein